jgi:transcription termination factor Rho
MYDILELSDKSLEQLKTIATEVGISDTNDIEKQKLIYKILDQQALQPATPEENKKRSRKPKNAKTKVAAENTQGHETQKEPTIADINDVQASTDDKTTSVTTEPHSNAIETVVKTNENEKPKRQRIRIQIDEAETPINGTSKIETGNIDNNTVKQIATPETQQIQESAINTTPQNTTPTDTQPVANEPTKPTEHRSENNRQPFQPRQQNEPRHNHRDDRHREFRQDQQRFNPNQQNFAKRQPEPYNDLDYRFGPKVF